MRAPTAAWRLVRAVAHGLHGLAIVLLRFPRLDVAARQARIAWWSAKMLRMLGLRLRVDGAEPPPPVLIVANHVSWLDIMAIHAVCPGARFVSKADVQHWPLVNRLVASAGTLYIERERSRDALRVVQLMADALRDGTAVAVFPEGTTGPGPQPLPFHANLLQAAVATATPVQPVALRYADATSRHSVAAQFLGETTLPQSLWRLAAGRDLVVHLRWLPPVATAGVDRRVLATRLRDAIAAALDGDDGAPAPASAGATAVGAAAPVVVPRG